jgi:hypothetical protein
MVWAAALLMVMAFALGVVVGIQLGIAFTKKR